MKLAAIAILGVGFSIGWLGYQTEWVQSTIKTNSIDSPNYQTITQPDKTPPETPITPPDPGEPDENPIKESLKHVALQVVNNTYPRYSVPITNKQAQVYGHNRFEPIEIPLAGGTGLILELNQYFFKQGEPIEITLGVGGSGAVSNTAKAYLIPEASPNTTTVSTSLKTESKNLFTGTIPTDDIDPGEYRLQGEVQLDGQNLKPTTTISINPDLGEITGTESPYIQGEDLVIPLEFKAKETGYYSLSATLQKGQEPIARLSVERQLSGQATFQLKAHQSVVGGKDLKGQGTLMGIVIRRLPDTPGDRTQTNFGPEDGIKVDLPDTSTMPTTPYRSAETERRKAFFNSLLQG